jgi:uncharacterized membrane protein
MRGLAVVIMIQCHVFNAFVHPSLQSGGPYVLSQFIGGMAAPLFLFMAGMTLAFQMDSLERRESVAWRRCLISFRRAGYIWLIAYLFRLSNCVASLPIVNWQEFTKVDILNCMGLAMAVFAGAAALDGKARARWTLLAGLAIAAAAPLVANIAWGNTPPLIQEYLAPGRGRGHFPFFPNAAYLGFGLAAGAVLRQTALEGVERLMQWAVMIGLALVITAQYFSNLPYSIYTRSNFWTDSPALILIRCGIALLLLAGSFLWTAYAAGAGWSWMQTLGKNSLLVYWVHVMLAYGRLLQPLKHRLGILPTALAAAAITALMVALSAGWMRWKARQSNRLRLLPLRRTEAQPAEAG